MTILLDLPDADYHARPELSFSTGKEYLRSPAHYLWKIRHRVESTEFDEGHAVHKIVLGVGMDMTEIPDSALSSNGGTNTKSAKAFIEAARAADKVPLKAAQIDRINAAATAVLTHPEAARYLNAPGYVEMALAATDPTTGTAFRGKLDKLSTPHDGRKATILDLKTTNDATVDAIRSAIHRFDYDLQAEAYRRLVRLTLGAEPAPVVLIFVEKIPPHGVQVIQLDHEDWIRGGIVKLDRILALHAECTRTQTWPSYPPVTVIPDPPSWYYRDLDNIDPNFDLDGMVI